MIGIEFAHHLKLGFGGRFGFDQLIGYANGPSRIRQNFLDADPRMHRGEKSLAIVAKAQDPERSDHGRRPRMRR